MHRFATTLALGALTVGIACIDMSAPSGPASISVLQLPSPSVVVGDMMRDSNGTPAPLQIIAYDADGQQLGKVDAHFFVTDSGAVAHINSSGELVGDRFGIVHVLGQVGSLQTPVVSIPVTAAPTKIAAASTSIDTLLVPNTTDSAGSTASIGLSVTLHGANDSTAQGFLVKYALLSAPATKAGATSPAVYLADDAGKLGSVDTTDAGGATRHLVVTSSLLADDSLSAGNKTDSAVVTASASYRGVPVSGSPVRFVVPIKINVRLGNAARIPK